MRKRILGGLLFSWLLGCSHPIPTQEGWYVKVDSKWQRLARVDFFALTSSQPTDLNALRAVISIAPTDDPQVVVVGKMPDRLYGFLRPDAGPLRPLTLALIEDAKQANTWHVRWPAPAPHGVLLIEVDSKRAVGIVNGDDVGYSYVLGVAAKKAGYLALAGQAFSAALRAKGGFAPAQNGLALVLAAQKKDLPRAKKLINQAIGAAGSDRERAQYFDTLGEIYFTEGDWVRSMESLDRSISLDPSNEGYYRHLGQVIAKAQRASPEQVVRDFYQDLEDEEYKQAAQLCIPFDVDRLKDAGELEPALRKMDAGGPFSDVQILNTMQHGEVTFFRIMLIGKDGGRRQVDLQLQFQDRDWRISLEG